MIDKNVEKILNQAFAQANQARYEFFTTEHVLLALARGDEMTYQGLADCGADVDELCQNITEYLEGNCPKLSNDEETTVPTSAFHRVVERANTQRKTAGKAIANGLHLIIAIMDEAESHAVYFLKKQNVSKLDLMQFVSAQEHGGDNEISQDSEETSSEENAVEKYCTNLNALAADGKIDPLIGREAELKRVIQVLARRRKNNPILVGEAGVGKTAIAEGLAKKIVDEEVPEILKDTVIFNVDLGSMVAGSKYRGDFEKRVKDLLASLQAIPNAVIFIDEIHTLLGAGSTSESTMDASNLLKPALSSGELKCIGATTYKEFKQTFEKNAALARRFQKVDIKEPTIEETYQILKGLQSRFEEFHGVKYSDEAIHAAVDLSDKYLNERFLPDKAIDLIDEAGAHAKILSKKALISERDIESVVASIAKIPQKTVSKDDKQSLKTLEKNLKKKIFGQDQAIHATAQAIKLARAGLKDLEKPIGSFLFTGPTGVGKTEVSKQLANELGINFIRFDMSEYMEAHTVSRLIGSPPGYVGFDQGGLLTDAVSKTPHCVLLLDEIEKAHPDIFNLLLQIMDYGKLTDSNGKTIVFNNVIMIMTSNVGADMLEKNSIGFQLNINADDDNNASAIKRTFSPEFRNRLTAVIKFAPLDKDSILKVVNKLLKDLSTALEKQNVTLKVSAPAKQWLLGKGYNRLMGARPMSRLIEAEIKAPLSELILFGELANGKGGEVSVGVDRKADKLVIRTVKKALAKL